MLFPEIRGRELSKARSLLKRVIAASIHRLNGQNGRINPMRLTEIEKFGHVIRTRIALGQWRKAKPRFNELQDRRMLAGDVRDEMGLHPRRNDHERNA